MDNRDRAISTSAHRVENVIKSYLYASLVFNNFEFIYNYNQLIFNFREIKKRGRYNPSSKVINIETLLYRVGSMR